MAIGYMILAAGLIGAMGSVMGMSWQAIGEGWVWSVTMGSVLLHTETECTRTRAEGTAGGVMRRTHLHVVNAQYTRRQRRLWRFIRFMDFVGLVHWMVYPLLLLAFCMWLRYGHR